MERNELKKDLERKRYFDNIRRFANKYDENETAKILNQMKQNITNSEQISKNLVANNYDKDIDLIDNNFYYHNKQFHYFHLYAKHF